MMKKVNHRDSSHRSRLDKLGVKENSVVCLVNVNDGKFLHELGQRTRRLSSVKAQEDSDLIF